MGKKAVGVIFNMEIKHLFSDTFTVLAVTLVPFLFAFFAVYIYAYGMNSDKEYEIDVYCEKNYLESVSSYLNEQEYVVNYVDIVPEKFGEKTIGIIVSNKIELYYDSSAMVNVDAFYEAQNIAYELSIITNLDVDVFFRLHRPNFELIDLNFGEKRLESKLNVLYSIVFFFVILGCDRFFSSEMQDVFARSRRNGTLDALKMTGVSTKTIALGKTLYGYFYMMCSYFSVILGIITGFLICNFDEKNIIASEFKGNAVSMSFLALSLFELGVITLSFEIIATAGKDEKSKSHTISFLFDIAFTIAIILPSYIDNFDFSYIPVVNMWDSCVRAISGNINYIGTLSSFIFTVICVMNTIIFVPKLIEQE